MLGFELIRVSIKGTPDTNALMPWIRCRHLACSEASNYLNKHWSVGNFTTQFESKRNGLFQQNSFDAAIYQIRFYFASASISISLQRVDFYVEYRTATSRVFDVTLTYSCKSCFACELCLEQTRICPDGHRPFISMILNLIWNYWSCWRRMYALFKIWNRALQKEEDRHHTCY